jgi:predicted acetyltransferase
MHVKVEKAVLENKMLIDNLMQYYFYDFSEFLDMHVKGNGRFGDYPNLNAYWSEEGHFPYLVIYEGRYAGFILVKKAESGGKERFLISEFFIMKKYRKSGLGKASAHQVFDRHKGNWEVLQVEKNLPAQAFWRKVISQYTNGVYTERTTEKGDIVQSFNNSH